MENFIVLQLRERGSFLMKCTKVELNFPAKSSPNRRMLCWANVVLDDELIIKGIRVYEANNAGESRRWIKFPERQIPFSLTGGEILNIPIVLSLTKDLLANITEEIFRHYEVDPRSNFNNRRSVLTKPTPIQDATHL